MNEFILRTKLTIPRIQPNTIRRSRLIDQLNAGLNRHVTLLSAPAGFGKTTLLGAWIGSLIDNRMDNAPHVAWVSLDLQDNNPFQFWSYVISSIQSVLPAVGIIGAKLLENTQAPAFDYVVNSLINDLMACVSTDAAQTIRPFLIFVLDDYQEIQDASIHSSLTYFIDNLPPEIHGVIASRMDPPLPLARWRALDQVTEVRATDLRFLKAEAVSFFQNAMSMNLPEAMIDALEERTEGWIVGLQLAALSLRDHPNPQTFLQTFGGTHRHVLDYLVMEVLDHLSEDDRIFLLLTSILQRLNGPLCNALTDRNDSQFILEKFDRQNLFVVPLDEERRWYRYHHLFAETLQNLMERSLHPVHTTIELHRRAAQWYYDHNMIAEAIDHAIAGQDYFSAESWIEHEIKVSLFRSSFYTIRHWLEMLPQAAVHANPILCIAFAGALLGEARFHEVEHWLNAAEAIINEDLSKERDTNYRGWIDAIRATVAINFGDEEKAISLSQSALLHLTDEDRWLRAIVALNLGDAYSSRCLWSKAEHAFFNAIDLCLADGNHSIASVALASLGMLYARQGQLRRAAGTLIKAIELPDSAPFSGKAYIYLSEIQLEWNNLEEAEHSARQGITLCQQWGHQEHLLDGHLALAYIQWAKGSLTDAQAVLDHAEAILHKNMISRPSSPGGPRGQQLHWRAERLAELRAQISLLTGELNEAVNWAKERGFHADSVDPWRAVTFAKLLIKNHQIHEVHLVLDRTRQSTEDTGMIWTYLYASVLLVMLLTTENRHEEAHQLLADLLVKAENEGYCRLFINEGPPMKAMLSALQPQRSVQTYIQRLLQAFKDPRNTRDTIKRDRATHCILPEPLTEREMEILRLLAAGKTNPQIAAELYLAVGTVKKHLNNIYGKLDVTNRTQALLKAGELKLV